MTATFVDMCPVVINMCIYVNAYIKQIRPLSRCDVKEILIYKQEY